MNNFFVLLKGELDRMKKYHILGASMLVAFIWVAILHFTGLEDVTGIFPLLLYIDATSMAMLMVGVTMFFEKQEGALKALLVSPISKAEYITAKTFANITSNVITLVIMYLYAVLFREIHINFAAILGAAVLIALFHSLLGFLLTYSSKDFTELLIGMFKYIIVLMLPVLLVEFGVIKSELLDKVLYIIPTKASMALLTSAAGGMDAWKIIFSIIYLVAASAGMYYLVERRFDKFAIKESGV